MNVKIKQENSRINFKSLIFKQCLKLNKETNFKIFKRFQQ
jgi:hypothetical protein